MASRGFFAGEGDLGSWEFGSRCIFLNENEFALGGIDLMLIVLVFAFPRDLY